MKLWLDILFSLGAVGVFVAGLTLLDTYRRKWREARERFAAECRLKATQREAGWRE